MPEVITIDPRNPDKAFIERAVDILRKGGVIAYPTETFYGLGADAFNEKTIEKIFTIKGRDVKNPVSVIIGNESGLHDLIAEIPESARLLIKRFWPGPLTLVFRASPAVPPLLTAGTGKIAIRISSHPIATALAQALRHPITATSANLSGARECTTAEEVMRELGGRIDAVIDGGTTPGGKGSTIVDLTRTPPKILREGAVSILTLENVFKQLLS